MTGVIIVNRVGDKISGSINGIPFSVNYSDAKYQAMKELEDKASNAKTVEELRYIVSQAKILTLENYGDFVETKSPYIKVNKDTNKFYLQYNGVISSKAMPMGLATKIIKAVEKSVDILPLIKFWVRFLHNQKYTDDKADRLSQYITGMYTNQDQVRLLMNTKGVTEAVAVEFSTTPQVSITSEGLLVGYKVSKEITDNYRDGPKLIATARESVDPQTGLIVYDDKMYAEDRIFEPHVMGKGGDAFYCGEYLGHIIRVGKIHRLPDWSYVNCNDYSTGLPGLHCGGLRYIRGFQKDGSITHNIFVDPSHIGAIADVSDSSGDGALRVLQYFVYNAFNGVNKNLYYSSKYSAWSKDDYNKMLHDAVNNKFLIEE